MKLQARPGRRRVRRVHQERRVRRERQVRPVELHPEAEVGQLDWSGRLGRRRPVPRVERERRGWPEERRLAEEEAAFGQRP